MNYNQLPECDIVMKGGVTSGVVYPAATAAVAKRFRFRSIGGTSAGAIAAVVTAAAEYARTVEQSMRGFDRLATIPLDLRTHGLLLRLFTPQWQFAPVFHTLVSVFSARPWWAKLPRTVAIAFVLLVLPAAVVLELLSIILQLHAPWRHPGSSAVGLLAVITIYVLTLFVALLPRNAYGFTRAGVLATWLADIVDEIAFGKGHSGGPLTFGHLWAPEDPTRLWPPPSASVKLREKALSDRRIDLQMMTTCVSLGRPYCIPFDSNIFWFDPTVLRRYFPKRIVQHMVNHARASEDAAEFHPLIAFPEAQDVPVVVAARMSLSFPILISAVQLHAVDYTDYDPQNSKAVLRPKPCWFSDGGLTSNFPVQLFDSPLPNRPTFGVDLRPFDNRTRYDPANESNNVSMVTTMSQDVNPPSSFSGGAATGFLSAVVGAMQNWADAAQARLPAYRDRIVNVHLRPNEGGLNLDMDAKVLAALELRGTAAGKLLVRRFDPSDTSLQSGWQMHRRIRYLSVMDMLQQFVRRFHQVWASPPANGPTFPQLITTLNESPPYKQTAKFAQTAGNATEAFANLDQTWNSMPIDFQKDAPRPQAELHAKPPL